MACKIHQPPNRKNSFAKYFSRQDEDDDSTPKIPIFVKSLIKFHLIILLVSLLYRLKYRLVDTLVLHKFFQASETESL